MHVTPGDIVSLTGEVISIRPINGGVFSCQIRTAAGDFWLPSTALGATSHGPIAAEAPPEPAEPAEAPTEHKAVEAPRQARGKKAEVVKDEVVE